MDRAARPILKWAGGKTQLLPEILRRLPSAIETYYEPFVGGAAVFFALAAEGRFQHAVLSDTNPDLVGLYRSVQRDVEGVIRALAKYTYDEDEYYRVRDSKQPRSPTARAARLIFLNKTGYNGLYRVNRAGQFNVPFGRYKNPTICDAENLRAAARALRAAELRVGDFATVTSRAREGDAVYFDPPYLPVSKTASFTAYDRNAFALADHERLAAAFADLDARSVAVLLSNSDTRATRRLFASFRVDTVAVSRAINSNAAKRGPISEILVSSAGSLRSAPRRQPARRAAVSRRS